MMTTSKNRPILMTGALVLIFVACAGLAVAKQGGGKGRMGGKGFGPEHRLEMMTQRLDLSDDQVAAIKGIHEKNRDKVVALKKDLQKLRHEMKGLMMEDNPSERKALELNEKIGDLRTEMKALKLKTRLAVRDQLTDEQRDKMILMQGKGGKGGKRGGRGGKGHEGRFGQGHKGCGPRGHGSCDGSGPGGDKCPLKSEDSQ